MTVISIREELMARAVARMLKSQRELATLEDLQRKSYDAIRAALIEHLRAELEEAPVALKALGYEVTVNLPGTDAVRI